MPEGLGGLSLLQLASAELPSGAHMQVWAGLTGGGSQAAGGGRESAGGSQSGARPPSSTRCGSSSGSSSAAQPEGGGTGAGAPRAGPSNSSGREAGALQPAADPRSSSAAARPPGGGPIQAATAPARTASSSEPAPRGPEGTATAGAPVPDSVPVDRQDIVAAAGAGSAAVAATVLPAARTAEELLQGDTPLPAAPLLSLHHPTELMRCGGEAQQDPPRTPRQCQRQHQQAGTPGTHHSGQSSKRQQPRGRQAQLCSRPAAGPCLQGL